MTKKNYEHDEKNKIDDEKNKTGEKHKKSKDKKEKGSSKKRGKEKKNKPAEEKGEKEAKVVDESYLRLKADFDNYRKRVLREKDELYRRANEDIIEELLPVLDHLDMALVAAADKADDPIVEGFRLVGNQLKNALAKFGLKVVETTDKEFDPNLHEAILHMPSTEIEENHIVSEARKGYKLGERLLRASQVVVSSGAPEEAETDESPADE